MVSSTASARPSSPATTSPRCPRQPAPSSPTRRSSPLVKNPKALGDLPVASKGGAAILWSSRAILSEGERYFEAQAIQLYKLPYVYPRYFFPPEITSSLSPTSATRTRLSTSLLPMSFAMTCVLLRLLSRPILFFIQHLTHFLQTGPHPPPWFLQDRRPLVASSLPRLPRPSDRLRSECDPCRGRSPRSQGCPGQEACD